MNSSNSTINNCSFYDSIYVAISAAASAANFVSLLANLLVLFFIILFKRWSFFNLRLIMYLSLAIIAGNVGGIVSGVGYKNDSGKAYDMFCIFAGFLFQITTWMILNAYICITTALMIKAFFIIDLEKVDILTVLLIFVSPIVINWIPFIRDGYGKSGAWCWIRSIDTDKCQSYSYGQVVQLVLWYCPVYAILVILILMYIMVVITFCRNRKKWKSDPRIHSEKRQALRYIISLLAYPVIYFIVNIFPLINRLIGFSDSVGFVPALWFLGGITYQFQGPAIAIVFLYSIKKKLNRVSIRAAFREWFHKVQIQEYPVSSSELEISLKTSTLDKQGALLTTIA